MSLIELPTTRMSDAELTTLLRRTRGFADPLLDLLSHADPLGLKRRTHRLGADDGAVGKVQDTLAWALNAVNVPGTQAWDDMSTDARVDWWCTGSVR